MVPAQTAPGQFHRKVMECPGCGAAGGTATGPEAPALEVQAGGRTFLQDAYHVLSCPACGLLYRNPVLSPAALDEYYSQTDFHKWEIDGYHPTERAVLDTLRALPSGSRILDYGCSSGRLLAGLVPAHECFGYEINRQAADAAALRGLHMLPDDPTKGGGAPSFDAVVNVDLFEHVAEPTSVMRRLFSLVKPGGLLLISTGNGDAPAIRRDPATSWYFRNVEHLCMMTRGYAEWLSLKLGSAIDLWQETSHYDTGWWECLQQRARYFAYWHMRDGSSWKHLLRHIPFSKRAANWELPPALTCTKDHVLLVLRKPASIS